MAETARAEKELDLSYSANNIYNPLRAQASFNLYITQFSSDCSSIGEKTKAISIGRHLKTFAGQDVQFRDVDEKFLRGFKRHLDKQLSPGTAYSYFRRLKQILNAAVRDRFLPSSPAMHVENQNRTVDIVEKQVLTLEELATLQNTPCRIDDIGRAMIFSSRTGMGLSELKKLKWSDINLKSKSLTYYRSKGRYLGLKPVTVPLEDDTIALLGKPGTGLVFDLNHDKKYINKIIGQWVRDAGIKKHITSYCFVHSFCTNLLKGKTDHTVIAKLRGHTSTRMIMRYLHPDDEQFREAVKGIS